MSSPNAWPSLEYASWAATKRSLHLYAQMLGKLRLALAPPQPNWMHTSLALTPRGFSTGLVPHAAGSVLGRIDVFDATLILETSDGRSAAVALDETPATVARVYADFTAALRRLDVDVTLDPVPQEIPDQTPLDRDDRPAPFERHDAQRWLSVVTASNAIFERWRARFFGRSGIQLWWGAFDFALLLFSGKHVEPPTDRGYLMKYDLDAEMLNVGFYPGDDANAAIFYGYIYPQPAGCETISLAPPDAVWSTALREWILPYEAVRAAADPAAALSAFLDAIYGVCGSAGGWNHAELSYTAPPHR
jgi:hypothetical protein